MPSAAAAMKLVALACILLLLIYNALEWLLYPTASDVVYRYDVDFQNCQGVSPGKVEDFDIASLLLRSNRLSNVKTKLSGFIEDNSNTSSSHDDELVDLNNEGDFSFGIPKKKLLQIIRYWKDDYEFEKRVEIMEKNLGPSKRVCINGIALHFHYQKTEKKKSKGKTIVLIHGWPGTPIEFLNVVPRLVEEGFNVITPSLPGFSLSSCSRLKNFNFLDSAVILYKLLEQMKRERQIALEEKVVIQGGDYGSFVASAMAQIEEREKKNLLHGIHLNMATILLPPLKFGASLSYFWVHLFGSEENKNKLGPTLPLFFSRVLEDTGYFHMQATKPNLIGLILNDSPALLGAWILDKFNGWSGNQSLSQFNLDELIDNLMLYYVTQSSASAARYYKGMVNDYHGAIMSIRASVGKIKTSILDSPNEIFRPPRFWLSHHKYKGLVRYTTLRDGGHFLAMEKPNEFAKDVIEFVNGEI